MKKKRLEILAPAGSFESLKAAVQAGADAVYMGGGRFGARAYADNPEGELMLEAIDYAHLYGVKLYLTVNTLLKDRELEGELYDYLKPCYEHGLDAVIVQDLGVMRAIQEWFPDLPIHASTQMTLCGAGGAKLLETVGAERVVLARELSLAEIARIRQEIGIEIECFVHGALCYCYSGQCLFSSILGGRSGNRGRCAQPCRLAYDVLAGGKTVSKKGENALLSPKDICTVDLIPQIAEAGVYSLKIEGRMKRPEYTAGVVRIYRKYADRYLEHGADGYYVEEADKRELNLLFNRDGFSRGYYEQHNGRNMMALWNRQPSDEEKREYELLIGSLRKQYVDQEKKRAIRGCLTAEAGRSMELRLEAGEVCVTVTGESPQIPANRPMEEAQLEKQLRKTGNTPFEWEDLRIQMKGELFVPIQALNGLRREALERLRLELIKSCWRSMPMGAENNRVWHQEKGDGAVLHISVESMQQLRTVLSDTPLLMKKQKAPLQAVYVDAGSMEEELLQAVDLIHKEGLLAYVVLPPIFRMKTEARYQEKQSFWRQLSADGYVLKNLEEYEFLKCIHWKKAQILDHNLYTFNGRSRELWREAGIHMQTNPLELNARELKQISAGDCIQIIYGRYPMMTTAGCLHRTLNQCRKQSGQWILKDRYQKEFPVKNNCRDCYNTIYNSQPLYLLDQMEALQSLGVGAYRIMFTTEGEGEVREVLQCWMEERKPQSDFTRGHFKRGVE
ncbi:MAG: U32 family peptidase [Clostridiales bacterium]|nr:U32 family peptidase [Clostridiales bacterium]